MAIRDVEHDPLPLPDGWFAVGWSHELREGEVRPIEYFGEELVLFRTRDGKARVIDAFCPHLGAHIGHGGRVVGETVQCPFHGWQYDGESGACVRIPYCDTIPARARLHAWPVQEKNGMIFVWRHAEKAPPTWDFPTLPEIGSEDWTEPRTVEWELGCHVQDAHENNNDPEHFFYVHKFAEAPPTDVQTSADGRHYRMVSPMRGTDKLGNEWSMELVRDSWGLGLTAVRMVAGPGAELLQFSSTTPLDGNRCLSRWLLTCSRSLPDAVANEFMDGMLFGVQQDIPIWRNKVHRARPVLCKADKMLGEFRQWARQFYSPNGREP